MKDRQRWQPEEDALLRDYVHHYGPREWHLISQRMNQPLDRDPKSCLERWKNYLKPGIKKGSLTPQEQALVISLQAKYGNKWKKIAAEVPGRTAKRLGKWWEVFKEKQIKQQNSKKTGSSGSNPPPTPPSVAAVCSSPEKAVQGTYDHILETFAEKYVQPYLKPAMPNLNSPSPVLSLGSGSGPEPDPSKTPSMVAVTVPVPVPVPVPPLPPWMNQNNNINNINNISNIGNNIVTNVTSATSCMTSSSSSPSPSVSLTLSPSEPVVLDPVHSDHTHPARFFPVQQMGTLVQYCKEMEEAKQNLVQHKKEATWRLSRLEQQLEAEKNRKRREKMEEVEAKIRCLREEENAALGRLETEYREQLSALQRDAEGKEGKLMEVLSNKQMKVSKMVEHMISGSSNHHHGLN